MQSTHSARPGRIVSLCLSLTLSAAGLSGCARPGPPKPPTLNVPIAVNDLSASRIGDVVELHLTVPRRTSDGVALRTGDLRGVLCRQLGTPTPDGCIAIQGIDVPAIAGAAPRALTLQDALPASLASGAPRLLSYRIQFFSPKGRSVGDSEPAYSVAGAAPAPVAGLSIAGARNGIVLSWTEEGKGEVLLERTNLEHTNLAAPSTATTPRPHPVTVPRRPARRGVATPERTTPDNITWLQANAEGSTGRTLDTTVEPGTPYRYRALRRRTVQLGGRSLELRSAPSAALEFTLQAIYPPATPTGLNVAGYFERSSQVQANAPAPTYAVDLIWQPVEDDSRTAALAGYNVYREQLDAHGSVLAPGTRLNTLPILLPAFHDNVAEPRERYRYRVTAIDTKGNESSGATTILEPQPAR